MDRPATGNCEKQNDLRNKSFSEREYYIETHYGVLTSAVGFI